MPPPLPNKSGNRNTQETITAFYCSFFKSMMQTYNFESLIETVLETKRTLHEFTFWLNAKTPLVVKLLWR